MFSLLEAIHFCRRMIVQKYQKVNLSHYRTGEDLRAAGG
jgi:hypothetical protein